MNISIISKVLAVVVVCATPLAAIAADSDLKTDNFAKVDTNRDGFIDAQEAKKAALNDTLFKKMDANSDGKISQSEFEVFKERAPEDN